jgi:hypothetical protein
MNKENPEGTGSFSLNRKAETNIGNYSFAEGYNNTASGIYSHAEGNETTASAEDSHAEGYNTTASGMYSHAEGYNTIASKSYSHTEGYDTKAEATGAHVEGLGTIAGISYSHVQGQYNINNMRTKYIHVVGNGRSDSERSNAHILDEHGNAWFAGDVYVSSNSGTNKDDGSVKLIREDQIGDNITIDDNGNISLSKDNVTSALGYTPISEISQNGNTLTFIRPGIASLTATLTDANVTNTLDINTKYYITGTTSA